MEQGFSPALRQERRRASAPESITSVAKAEFFTHTAGLCPSKPKTGLPGTSEGLLHPLDPQFKQAEPFMRLLLLDYGTACVDSRITNSAGSLR